jgi:NADPH:quinone reductase-like Zn-dependent oxidoreductase
MKAVRIHEFGGPDMLRVEDLPIPEPGPGEARIRVMAASVNPVDYKMRNGGYLPPEALPLTLGRDVAGVVDAIGSGASAFKKGEAAFVLLGREHGGYVEFVTEKTENCARKPARLDFVEAAAVPLAGLTAWQGLFDYGRLQPGQTVLIHGAAGGVGHLAVQFAHARDAIVFATCAGRDAEFVMSLGASEVIDYRRERFEDQVRDVDLVFDLVDKDVQDRSWAVLKDGGALISTLRQPDKAKAAAKHARAQHYIAQPNGRELAEIARLIDAGKVRPHIDRIFPLDEAAEAERTLEQDHVRGKIVLEVASQQASAGA